MNVNVSDLFLAFVSGLAVGLFFFGGLWLTLCKAPRVRYPGLLSFGSFLGRMIITLLAFYFVMGAQWQRLPACMGGFLVMRMVLTRLLHPDRKSIDSIEERT